MAIITPEIIDNIGDYPAIDPDEFTDSASSHVRHILIPLEGQLPKMASVDGLEDTYDLRTDNILFITRDKKKTAGHLRVFLKESIHGKHNTELAVGAFTVTLAAALVCGATLRPISKKKEEKKAAGQIS